MPKKVVAVNLHFRRFPYVGSDEIGDLLGLVEGDGCPYEFHARTLARSRLLAWVWEIVSP